MIGTFPVSTLTSARRAVAPYQINLHNNYDWDVRS